MPALGEEFDLCLTDPPYNVGITYADSDDRRDDYAQWTGRWFSEICRLTRNQIVTPGRSNEAIWAALTPSAVWAAWTKRNAMKCGWVSYLLQWEPIIFNGTFPRTRASDIFDYPIIPGRARCGHPVPKPLALWEDLMRHYARGSVLDPFLGSGTTLVACYRLGRSGVGIEISEAYCQLAAERLEKEIAQGRLFEPSEVTPPAQYALAIEEGT
jgi:DNA modification methylase